MRPVCAQPGPAGPSPQAGPESSSARPGTAAVLAGRLTLGVALALVGGLRARARARPVDEGAAAVAVDGPAAPAAA
ncbi:hypothetical protein [Streptomyces roseolus]|uniref:hypothetical protein n=1 Tax=Streptomyces roseolus TaxID=67358 RepID=UPI0036545699